MKQSRVTSPIIGSVILSERNSLDTIWLHTCRHLEFYPLSRLKNVITGTISLTKCLQLSLRWLIIQIPTSERTLILSILHSSLRTRPTWLTSVLVDGSPRIQRKLWSLVLREFMYNPYRPHIDPSIPQNGGSWTYIWSWCCCGLPVGCPCQRKGCNRWRRRRTRNTLLFPGREVSVTLVGSVPFTNPSALDIPT